jgi:hypothetical protein
MSDRDNKILSDTMNHLNEFDVPTELIPKDKQLCWTRYFLLRTDSNIHSFDLDSVMEKLSVGFTFCRASDYQSIMTDAKKALSDRFVMYDGQILCERIIGSKALSTKSIADIPEWYQISKIFKYLKHMRSLKERLHETIW